MRDLLAEAFELAEDSHITEDNLRGFTFTNAVKSWGTQNSVSFRGKRVEKEAAAAPHTAQLPAFCEAAK
ncbi:MAG: hypothetical protein ACREFB_03560 [Stellaceae bacterium]